MCEHNPTPHILRCLGFPPCGFLSHDLQAYVNELLRAETPVCFITHPDQRWELLAVPGK